MRIDQQIPTQPGRGAHGADAPDEVLSVPAQRPGEAVSKFGYQKDYRLEDRTDRAWALGAGTRKKKYPFGMALFYASSPPSYTSGFSQQ